MLQEGDHLKGHAMDAALRDLVHLFRTAPLDNLQDGVVSDYLFDALCRLDRLEVS